MDTHGRILIVEDEEKIARFLELELTHEGYEVGKAADGRSALDMALASTWDLILLDVMLPQLNGLEVLRRVRRESDVPVILLTARGAVMDKVSGLDAGANDYITKPFDSKEMAARVKAVLRRTMGQTEEEEETADDTLSFPGLTVSLSRYEVFYEGKKLEMPPKELEVLYFLASHVNQLFTRGQLLDQVWGFQVEVESRTVDVHVKRLRDKLVGCEKYGWRIQTIWGRGYKFEVIK